MNDRIGSHPSKPNFFIVGAPRCGTTSLTQWLTFHPDVYMPQVKVPFHFGTDLDMIPKRKFRNRDSYLALYDGATAQLRLGDSTPFYLYSVRAAQEIKDFDPQSRIVIMLRNPADMMYSMHARNLMDGNEEIRDFSAALEAEPERKKGRCLPKRCFFRQGLYYRELAQFPDQVQRFLNICDSTQIHVIIFDDLKAAPHQCLDEVLSFLGLRGFKYPILDRANKSINVRSPSLAGLLREPPSFIRLLPPSLRQALMWRLNRWNRTSVAPPPIDKDIRRRLLDEFTPDIHRLGILLNRDLSHWLR